MTSKYKSEFRHDILVPFSYMHGGSIVEGGATYLTVKAPSNKNLADVCIIEQEYQSSMLASAEKFSELANKMTDEQRKESKKENTPEEEADGMLTMMMAGGANVSKCYEALRRILLSGSKQDPTTTVDDVQERFTDPMFQEMSPLDTKKLLGLYIVNFFNMGA